MNTTSNITKLSVYANIPNFKIRGETTVFGLLPRIAECIVSLEKKLDTEYKLQDVEGLGSFTGQIGDIILNIDVCRLRVTLIDLVDTIVVETCMLDGGTTMHDILAIVADWYALDLDGAGKLARLFPNSVIWNI